MYVVNKQERRKHTYYYHLFPGSMELMEARHKHKGILCFLFLRRTYTYATAVVIHINFLLVSHVYLSSVLVGRACRTNVLPVHPLTCFFIYFLSNNVYTNNYCSCKLTYSKASFNRSFTHTNYVVSNY